MSYYYNSNYSQNFDNYQYYNHYYYNNQDSYQEPSYINQYSNTEFYQNPYQHAPTPSLVGYYYSTYNQPEFFTSKNTNFQENSENYYYDPVSTEFVVSYNSTTTKEGEIVEEKEDEPKKFHGGYDITKEYGKPLPPSEEICHPPSKNDPKIPSLRDVNFGDVPSPYLKDDKKVIVNEGGLKKGNGGEVINEENVSDFESDEDYDNEEYYEDDEEYDDEDEEEEKQDGIGAVPTKQAQNLEGETKAKDKGNGNEVIQEKKALDLEVNDKSKAQLDEPKPKNESISEVIQEQKALELPKEDEEEEDYEDEDEDEDEDEGEGESKGEVNFGNEGRREENYENQVRRQIPPGYGIEAFDICEGLFGGYFPCLWRRNQRIYNHQREINVNVNENISDYDYCWKETADYLFGNPNPYGGSMPEKGSYGDPIYNYHRHFPHQNVTQQVDFYGGSSSYLENPRY